MSNFDRCIIVLAPLYATIDKLSKKQRYPALGLNRKNFNVMPGRQRDIGRPVSDRGWAVPVKERVHDSDNATVPRRSVSAVSERLYYDPYLRAR